MSQLVEELDLTVRSANCLKNNNIVFIRDLVQKTPEELLRNPNMGKKSISNIEEALAKFGLRLGMQDVDVQDLRIRSHHLNTFVDIMAVIKKIGFRDIDELIQSTADQLAEAPYHLDAEQISIVEDGLAKWGLGFGTVMPVPFSPEITCQKDIDNFRDEAACIVEQLLSSHPASWNRCFISYYGLGGDPVLTMEEIGGRAGDFGFDGAVTRARVQQIVDRVENEIKRRAGNINFTLWDACVKFSKEILPASINSFVSVYGFDAISNSKRTYTKIKALSALFRLDFPFDLIELGGSQFVINSDDRMMKDVLDSIQSLPSDLYYSVASLSQEIPDGESLLARAIDVHPRWEFLDDDLNYIWKKPTLPPVNYIMTGNAILSSLCKVFSVATSARSRDLVDSISRDRSIRRDIPIPVLEGIAKRSGLFNVRNGKVSRRENKRWFTLGDRDKALVKICLDKGQIVPSDVLYSSLIRHNLSRESAALTVAYSPFLIHVQTGVGTKEGIYKFVFSLEDVDSVEFAPNWEYDAGSAKCWKGELSEACLRIEISTRVLRLGNYSMEGKEIPDGEWRIVTVERAEVGGVAISGKLVKGLKKVVGTMELVKGDVVELRLSEEEGVLVATKGVAEIPTLDT